MKGLVKKYLWLKLTEDGLLKTPDQFFNNWGYDTVEEAELSLVEYYSLGMYGEFILVPEYGKDHFYEEGKI